MKTETKEILRNSVYKGVYYSMGIAYWCVMGIGILIGLATKGAALAITFAALAAAGWWCCSKIIKTIWKKKGIK